MKIRSDAARGYVVAYRHNPREQSNCNGVEYDPPEFEQGIVFAYDARDAITQAELMLGRNLLAYDKHYKGVERVGPLPRFHQFEMLGDVIKRHLPSWQKLDLPQAELVR